MKRPDIPKLCISGEHVIWELEWPKDSIINHFIEVYNWKTGQVIKVRYMAFSLCLSSSMLTLSFV